MQIIDVPTLEQVTSENRASLEALKKRLGFVPNLYATFAYSPTALGTYLALQGAPTSLDRRAREVVNLAVSEANRCEYCLAAHTVVARGAGFTDAQILELRRGEAPFDRRLGALARLARQLVVQRGRPDRAVVQAFLDAGWNEANLVDAVMAVGDKIISNYLHGATGIPVDFPAAPALEPTPAAA